MLLPRSAVAARGTRRDSSTPPIVIRNARTVLDMHHEFVAEAHVACALGEAAQDEFALHDEELPALERQQATTPIHDVRAAVGAAGVRRKALVHQATDRRRVARAGSIITRP
jgi:hypothetical protein